MEMKIKHMNAFRSTKNMHWKLCPNCNNRIYLHRIHNCDVEDCIKHQNIMKDIKEFYKKNILEVQN